MNAYQAVNTNTGFVQYGNPINVSCNKDFSKISNIRFSRKDGYSWREYEYIEYWKSDESVELLDDPYTYEVDKRVSAGHQAAATAYGYLIALVAVLGVLALLIDRYTVSENSHHKSVGENR